MANYIRGYYLRIILAFCLGCATGAANCATAQPEIKKEINEQRKENEEAIEIAEKDIPLGHDRDRVVGALKNSSELLSKAGKAVEKAQAGEEKEKIRADKNQKAATNWHWTEGILVAGAIALVIAGLKEFGSKIPVIGRFF